MTDRPRFSPAWRTFLGVAVLAVVAAAVAYSPPTTETRVVTGAPGATASPLGPADATHPGQPSGGNTEQVVVVDEGTRGSEDVVVGGGDVQRRLTRVSDDGDGKVTRALECRAGANGGSTDVGVSATTIRLGATIVDSGPGASFLRDARVGIQAVKNKVNREGGICGRKLEVILVDDGWDRQRGLDFIRNLVEGEKVFALSVVPSSEGLDAAAESGYLRERKVPVVGSDGMLKSQYTDPYIWPVAASTVSTMHIVAKYAVEELGVQNPGIVFDTFYRFGREGAIAFTNAVERLTGRHVRGFNPGDPAGSLSRCQERFCGIRAAQASYTSEINEFNRACDQSPRCDLVVLLLEPTTALTWINQGGRILADGRTHGAQPLFTRQFAESCRRPCHEMRVWTGYLPAIGANLGKPAVATYRDEIVRTSSSADITNAFAQGAYTGMSLLVEALKRVGPLLTRERLVAVLDSMTFDPGLTARPLSWQRGNHFANTTMQAYSIQYGDRFSGWRDLGVSVTDPWVGLDI